MPYVVETRKRMELALDFPAVDIMDIFAAHRCQSVLDYLEANHIKPLFVPPGCTGELQPLDVSVNDMFKKELRNCFSNWYAEQVSSDLSAGKEIEDIKIDLRISFIKPIHANWLLQVITKIKENKIVILSGFEKSGISSCFY